MQEKLNIDKLFNEASRHFKASAPEGAWQKISDDLKKKQKRRLLLWVWRSLSFTLLISAVLLSINIVEDLYNEQFLPDKQAPLIHKSISSLEKDFNNPHKEKLYSESINNLTEYEDKSLSIDTNDRNSGSKTEQQSLNSRIRKSPPKSKSSEYSDTTLFDYPSNNSAYSISNNGAKTKIVSANFASSMVTPDKIYANSNLDTLEISMMDSTANIKDVSLASTFDSSKSIIDSRINNKEVILMSQKETDSLLIIENSHDAPRNPKKLDVFIGQSIGIAFSKGVSEYTESASSFKGYADNINFSSSAILGIDLGVKFSNFRFSTGVKVYKMMLSGDFVQEKKDMNFINSSRWGQTSLGYFDIDISESINGKYSYQALSYNHIYTSYSIDIMFIELPINIGYELSVSKFYFLPFIGINSTFINNNSIKISDGSYIMYGEIQNLRSVFYSASVGLGIGYPLSKHWKLGVNTEYAYGLGSMNQSANYDFRPSSLKINSTIYYVF